MRALCHYSTPLNFSFPGSESSLLGFYSVFVPCHSGQEYEAIVIAGMFLLFAKSSFFFFPFC